MPHCGTANSISLPEVQSRILEVEATLPVIGESGRGMYRR
jgi:hypothetical protein